MKVKLEAEFDLDTLRKQIESSKTIKGDEAYFEQLSQMQAVKLELKALEDELMSVEAEAKGLINSKAKSLYGDNWQVIQGENFKITRSKTGDVYLINGSPNSKFIKIKKSVDSKAVDDYVVEKGSLPTGIEVNDQRGESIQVKINDHS